MTSRNDIIKLLEERRDTIKKFGVTELGIFGSFARGEQQSTNDIDILVTQLLPYFPPIDLE